MKRYSIGEVSKKLGVTSSFLKYYEQHGVLDPHVAQNGYRSYEGRHISVVQECVKLRNLGYSAAELRSMLNSPYEETLDALEAKQEALERQICYLKYAKKYISMAREEAHFFHEDPCWRLTSTGIFSFWHRFRISISLRTSGFSRWLGSGTSGCPPYAWRPA